MNRFEVLTEDHQEVQEITNNVSKQIPAGITGTVTVFVEHTTAGVIVNEAESRLLSDFEQALSDIVPENGWQHDQIDDNADSHIRAMLLGPSVTIPVHDGELQLGTWQSVLFVECDGPRTRQVTVVVE
ncbi:secondary thiamine-phosphate synthase enzyme YjbQ [Halovenus rubra]|uniref:Secondary thiamine-phosphate synthase enzyme YjbQ n=2 Tax=Halovenus rubra TaxID=869890 RepID=A0ABD5XA93_9EURY|nr:secondary thiamine-phosphate synthase enzyme YjbQ [Halovenus rubra]